jgi:hypothetical protein
MINKHDVLWDKLTELNFLNYLKTYYYNRLNAVN